MKDLKTRIEKGDARIRDNHEIAIKTNLRIAQCLADDSGWIFALKKHAEELFELYCSQQDTIRSLEAKVEEQALWLGKLTDSLQDMISKELMVKAAHDYSNMPYANPLLTKATALLAEYKQQTESK